MLGWSPEDVLTRKPIRSLKIDDWAITFTKAECEEFHLPHRSSFDPSPRKIVELLLVRPDGSHTRATLSRTSRWITENRVEVGGTIYLDLPEMGAVGHARVLSIEDSEPTDLKLVAVAAAKGLGIRVGRITGLFRHDSALVYNLRLLGEQEPIGATPQHPFWSVDRNRWVSAEELRIGERVKTVHAATTIESMMKCPTPEPVYNIEVEGDHVYRIGDHGLLVHNQSAAVAYNEWFSSLKTCSQPATGPVAAAFEKRACGTTQYLITGGGIQICVDAIEETAAVDCKAVENPGASAQLGTASDFWAELGPVLDLRQLRRYEQVIGDACNPLDRLIIAVEDERAVAYCRASAHFGRFWGNRSLALWLVM